MLCNAPLGVTGSGADDVWAYVASGCSNGKANAILHWNGRAWTALANSTLTATTQPQSIDVAMPTDAWVIE
jgi:hypothetical protein